MRFFRASMLTLAASLWATGAAAHHSFAVHFVSDELISVQGVVTKYRFANPHGEVEWTSINEAGEEEHWRAETNSPNMLRRRGWDQNSVKVGDEVTVTGFPARDGSNYMRVNRIDFADGRELVGQGAAAQD